MRRCGRKGEGRVMARVVGRLERAPEHPERLSLVRDDGTVSNRFARDQGREEIARVLADAGFTLNDDDTVTAD